MDTLADAINIIKTHEYVGKEELRGVKINGKVNLLVRNKKEFQAALENPSADIVFAHSMSKKLRGEMVKIAEGKKVRITNFKTMIK